MLATGSTFKIGHAQSNLQSSPANAAPAIGVPPHPVSAQQSLEGYLSHGMLRGVEAKEHLFTEGDKKAYVYLVVTGAICVYKVLPDGRRQVIDFAYPGDCIGLGSEPVERLNAQATVATRVKCAPLDGLRQAAARDPRIGVRLYEALSIELGAMRDHLICVSQRSAIERVTGFLLTLSQRNERRGRDPLKVELAMTRADIGDFLGLTIETVSRAFSKLKALGLIEIDQGTIIRLVDNERLEALADGERTH